jgi:hypothetical protein
MRVIFATRVDFIGDRPGTCFNISAPRDGSKRATFLCGE